MLSKIRKSRGWYCDVFVNSNLAGLFHSICVKHQLKSMRVNIHRQPNAVIINSSFSSTKLSSQVSCPVIPTTVPYFCLYPPICFLTSLSFFSLLTPPDANSRKQESEWKEKAKVELEEWHARQNEQLEKTKTNNRYWCLRRIETGQNINIIEGRLMLL